MRHGLKKRRSKRNVLSVSLFPFLAVLICTLGVLIVMLVMAVKSADVEAEKTQASQDSENQERIKQLEDAVDFQIVTIEGLEMIRPEALTRLEDSRANRSYLEEEIRKLKSEYKRVGEDLLLVDRQSKMAPEEISFSEEASQTELEQLKQKIELTKSNLSEKRKVVKKTGPAKYQIVPHKGSGGTFRRPIFLECTADAITLQPSGIRLLKSEFVPPLEPGNMVDSALLAIREYWKRYDLAGQEGNPYPLIVVRPGGAQTFVLARRAMKSWDDEFGYELVESETPLEFGVPDPQLNEEIEAVVAEARIRQRNQVARAAMMRGGRSGMGRSGGGSRLSGRNARPGLTASGPRGGFVSNAGGFDELRRQDQSQNQSNVRRTSGQSEAGDQTSDRNAADQQNRNNSRATSMASNDNQFVASSNSAQQSNSQSSSQQSVSSQSQSGASGGPGGESKLQNPYADQAIAKERGSNWALPTQTPGATGYLRPIRVVCHPNLIEVLSGGRRKQIQMFGGTAAAIDPLIDEIWQQIDAWGVPGPNGFWKPQLNISIAPNGRERFLQLKGLLHRSGLVVEESR